MSTARWWRLPLDCSQRTHGGIPPSLCYHACTHVSVTHPSRSLSRCFAIVSRKRWCCVWVGTWLTQLCTHVCRHAYRTPMQHTGTPAHHKHAPNDTPRSRFLTEKQKEEEGVCARKNQKNRSVCGWSDAWLGLVDTLVAITSVSELWGRRRMVLVVACWLSWVLVGWITHPASTRIDPRNTITNTRCRMRRPLQCYSAGWRTSPRSLCWRRRMSWCDDSVVLTQTRIHASYARTHKHKIWIQRVHGQMCVAREISDTNTLVTHEHMRAETNLHVHLAGVERAFEKRRRCDFPGGISFLYPPRRRIVSPLHARACAYVRTGVRHVPTSGWWGRRLS